MYVCKHTYIHTYVHIYIYIPRKQKERNLETHHQASLLLVVASDQGTHSEEGIEAPTMFDTGWDS